METDQDAQTMLHDVEANIAKYQVLVAAEDDKMLRYKVNVQVILADYDNSK